MKIIRTRVMRGPNMWHTQLHNIIVLNANAGAEADLTEDYAMDVRQRLEEYLDKSKLLDGTLIEYLLGFLNTGNNKICLVPALAIALLRAAGQQVSWHRCLPGRESGTHILVFEYLTEKSAVLAGKEAMAIANGLLSSTELPALRTTINNIAILHCAASQGPSTLSILNEARRRGIPVIESADAPFVQLGYGAFQRRISGTITNQTSGIGVDIAGNKEDTKKLLASFEIPVPKGVTVKDRHELKAAIDKIGYPLVIKPLTGHQGQGATINVRDWLCALGGLLTARRYSKEIMVESFVSGHDYRLLVINGKYEAAALRTPAMVTGDGRSSIDELIKKVNADPRRGKGHTKILTRITVDPATKKILREKGLDLKSVLKRGEVLYLKETANLSTGGTSRDVTDLVHPENIFMAEQIAAITGLDVCGIDVMTTDISKPLKVTGGAVLEVNAAPGFRMHTHPSEGQPRNVGKAVVDMLYPPGSYYSIPIVAITGTNGKTTTTRLIAHIVRFMGRKVGYTNTDGIYINDRLLSKGDSSGPGSARMLLRNPTVDFAVLECARGGIARSGLGFQECMVGVVTNVTADHLGLDDIHTVDEMAQVKSVVVRSVHPSGLAVLNADDERVYQMREVVRSRVALFSRNPQSPHVKAHIWQGGLCAVEENGWVVLYHGRQAFPLAPVTDIPLTLGGRAVFNTENVLAAILAAYGSGFPLDGIRNALLSFSASADQTPGRLNLFHFPKFEVMVDYAHNPAGLEALGRFLENVEATSKVGIITAVGDRRSEDIVEIGRISAKLFDNIIIRLDEDLRGRTPQEMIDLLKEGMHKVDPKVEPTIIPHEKDALTYAISHAQQGDFITVCTEKADKAVQVIQEELKNYIDV